MQRRITTSDIINHIDLALDAYDANCKGFLNGPGWKGRKRRAALVKLKNNLPDKTSDEAFALLYHFYVQEEPDARLISHLRLHLFFLIGITPPEYRGNLADYVEEMCAAKEKLTNVGQELLYSYGLSDTNENKMMMTSMRKGK